VTPDVVVDVGNSRIKWGRPGPGGSFEKWSLPPDEPGVWDEAINRAGKSGPVRWAVAGVHPARRDRFVSWAEGRGDSVLVIRTFAQLPLRVEVDEPAAVGIDRLLNAVGARLELPASTPAVIIDVGTAMTVDLLDDRHVYVGGAILPGPRMMFEALHRYTAKLPLVEGSTIPSIDPPGKNTHDAISVGVMAATLGAADVLVREYAALCRNRPWVVMTGGALGGLADYHFGEVENTITCDTLTLRGIYSTAEALP